jgi:Putative auto-transporter adhesin, head GIN domain
MKKIALFALLLASLSLASCKKDLVASGVITKVEKQFSGYNAIDVSDGIDLVFSFNNNEKVTVEASDNIQQYITVTQVGNRLIIKQSTNVIIGNNPVKVYIDAKKINNIVASGGADISSTNQFKSDTLTLNASGGSSFRAELAAMRFTVDDSGGGKVSLTGTSNDFVLNSTGGGDMQGFGFITKRFVCNVQGGGNAMLTVTETLAVTASGGSTIAYQGAGVVTNQVLSGGSEIIKK